MSTMVEEIKDLFNEIFETQIESGVDPDVASKTCSYVMHSYFSERKRELKEEKKEKEKEKYKESVKCFIDEFLDLSIDSLVRRSDLYSYYLMFSADNKKNALPRNTFYKRIKSYGINELHRNNGDFFKVGIK